MSARKTARSDSCRRVRAAGRRAVATLRVLVAVLALAAPAAAQDVTTQFWPEIDTFVRLNDNMRIYVPASNTREGTDDSDQDGTVGVYLDYYAAPIAKLHLLGPANTVRTHRLLLRAGYGYTAGTMASRPPTRCRRRRHGA